MSARPPRDDGAPRGRPDRGAELRVFGLHACRAVFAKRPGDVRKVWVNAARAAELGEVLRRCAQQRVGYNLVGDEDLVRLTGSQHHEGVCFDVRRAPAPTLASVLAALPAEAPARLLLLERVGNPHNLGAVLRSAAHFGVLGILQPPGEAQALSGAACRVAEGGAEQVPLIQPESLAQQRATLARAGFAWCATVVRGGTPLYEAMLPRRAVLAFGAEGEGLDPRTLAEIDQHLRIPGTGAVESLNIATATAIVLAEHWRRHGQPRARR